MLGSSYPLTQLHIPGERNPQTFSLLCNAQAAHEALPAIYSMAKALSPGYSCHYQETAYSA